MQLYHYSQINEVASPRLFNKITKCYFNDETVRLKNMKEIVLLLQSTFICTLTFNYTCVDASDITKWLNCIINQVYFSLFCLVFFSTFVVQLNNMYF